jgi:hypothetical protein
VKCEPCRCPIRSAQAARKVTLRAYTLTEADAGIADMLAAFGWASQVTVEDMSQAGSTGTRSRALGADGQVMGAMADMGAHYATWHANMQALAAQQAFAAQPAFAAQQAFAAQPADADDDDDDDDPEVQDLEPESDDEEGPGPGAGGGGGMFHAPQWPVGAMGGAPQWPLWGVQALQQVQQVAAAAVPQAGEGAFGGGPVVPEIDSDDMMEMGEEEEEGILEEW